MFEVLGGLIVAFGVIFALNAALFGILCLALSPGGGWRFFSYARQIDGLSTWRYTIVGTISLAFLLFPFLYITSRMDGQTPSAARLVRLQFWFHSLWACLILSNTVAVVWFWSLPIQKPDFDPAIIPLAIGVPAWLVSALLAAKSRLPDKEEVDLDDPDVLPNFYYLIPYASAWASVPVTPFMLILLFLS